MRWWRFALLALAGVVAAIAGTVLAVAVNVATGGTAAWFPAVEQHPLRWMAGATGAVAAAGLVTWWAQRGADRKPAALVPAEQRPEPWVVDRPAEVAQVVRGLRRRGGATVGVTTAVHGAGGFGKTTVAKLVRADRRVLRRFGGRVYWVTLGRDVRRDALAREVNDLITQLEPDHPATFTDARQAGEHLAAVLAAGPPRLLVLDDVWFEDQLAAFPVAGRCARLVTTRIPSLVVGGSVPVKVGQMSVTQARAVLLADLPYMPGPAVVGSLVHETGRWPLLLRLINKVLIDQARLRLDITEVARELLDQIRRSGALQVDQLTGASGQQLDVNDPDERQRAVRATIEASTGLLSAADRTRFAELAVFAEDETVPIALVAALWQTTGGLDQMTTGTFCARLADLALVSLIRTDDGGAITLHDVIRDFLCKELGNTRLAQLHRVLLQAAAAGMPTAATVTTSRGRSGNAIAWWELPASVRYLWDHLIEHLLAADSTGEAEAVAVDLRWVGARLEQSGPAGPYADLALIDTARAERLRRLFAQTAHLLAPTEPSHSVIDILYSRAGHDPDWGAQVAALQRDRALPALINRWPLPDLPDPALRRTLTGDARVKSVVIAPDGTWLATAGYNGPVRIWDAATGQQRVAFAANDSIMGIAIAPDGTWLATAGYDGSVRIWDAAMGQQRVTLTGHTLPVTAVAIAPDGTWLAAAADRKVRIWDPVTGVQKRPIILFSKREGTNAIVDFTWPAKPYHALTMRAYIWARMNGEQKGAVSLVSRSVNSVVVAPDGTWLATASHDGSVRIWDAATRQQRTAFTASHYITGMAMAPDGTWLATGGHDKSVRIWDAVTGQQRVTLTGHTDGVDAVAIAPDGTWLATGGHDKSVRIWDAVTGQQRVTLTGHTDRVDAVAIAPDGTWLAATDDQAVRIWDPVVAQRPTTRIDYTGPVSAVAMAPDGTWLATGGSDGSVRIWDAATRQQRTAFTASHHITGIVIAPDGTWLATTSHDKSVRIWDAATGQQRTAFTTKDPITGIVIAPDDIWLATTGYDRSVRIWDAVTGQQCVTLTGHTGPVAAVAIAPDGTWLATGGHDKSVRIWDAVTGQQRVTLTGHTDRVDAVAIAPDATWLATVSHDRSVRIWNAVTGAAAAMMRLENSANSCAWSPCGESLVMGGQAGMYHFTFKP